MRTDSFESVITPEAIEKCKQYSAFPEKLEELLKTCSVKVKFTGIKNHFPDDKVERLTGIFEISREGHLIRFPFGFSINDTNIFDTSTYSPDRVNIFQGVVYNSMVSYSRAISKAKKEFYEGLLYDCLTSCRVDADCPSTFSEFCSEYGYLEDSIKARDLFIVCLEQAARVKRTFTEEELTYLPS